MTLNSRSKWNCHFHSALLLMKCREQAVGACYQLGANLWWYCVHFKRFFRYDNDLLSILSFAEAYVSKVLWHCQYFTKHEKLKTILNGFPFYCLASVAQRQSVSSGSRGPGFETRLCHRVFPIGKKILLGGPVRWECSLDRAFTTLRTYGAPHCTQI